MFLMFSVVGLQGLPDRIDWPTMRRIFYNLHQHVVAMNVDPKNRSIHYQFYQFLADIAAFHYISMTAKDDLTCRLSLLSDESTRWMEMQLNECAFSFSTLVSAEISEHSDWSWARFARCCDEDDTSLDTKRIFFNSLMDSEVFHTWIQSRCEVLAGADKLDQFCRSLLMMYFGSIDSLQFQVDRDNIKLYSGPAALIVNILPLRDLLTRVNPQLWTFGKFQ